MTEPNESIPPIRYSELFKPLSINEPNEFTTRDFEEYKAFLFPEDEYKDKDFPIFHYFSLQGGRAPIESIQATFTGVEGFFHQGAVILDIGSGSGKAVAEMNSQFSSKGVKVIGLDKAYEKEKPIVGDPEMFKSGSWDNMPFEDNTFTGLLSVESFPRYRTRRPESTIKTIKEITRVAKPDAVWRATFSRSFTDEETLIHTMVENGWETFLIPSELVLIARLLKK